MSGKTVRAFAVAALLLAGGMPVSAETAASSETETVTVTGTRLRLVFHEFLKDFVAPTPITGKIARWERRICPLVVGQNPRYTAFITQRIKVVALAAGAGAAAGVSEAGLVRARRTGSDPAPKGHKTLAGGRATGLGSDRDPRPGGATEDHQRYRSSYSTP